MGNEESMKNRHYSINSNTLGEHPELHITNIMVMVLYVDKICQHRKS